MIEKQEEDVNCSFCGLHATEVGKLIAGDTAYICDACIDICVEVMRQAADLPLEEPEQRPAITPETIKAHLDNYVIGQDAAKRSIAVAIYNQYVRNEYPTVDGVELVKENVILIGPTGSGKSLIVETAAKMLDIPYVIADATTFTEAGYVGEDVENLITRLYTAAGNNADKAAKGIVFLDEVDKLRSQASNSGTRDVSGTGVQQALLKMFESSEVNINPGGKRQGIPEIRIDTSGILFVLSGAFVGLDKIMTDERNEGIGFMSNVTVDETPVRSGKVTPEHLIKFGLIPELIGRLPIITILDELTEDQLIHVMTEPKNALLKQYQAKFKIEKLGFEITDDALHYIAKEAIERKTGARGLKAVLASALVDLQFVMPSLSEKGVAKVIVTKDVIENGGEPHMVHIEEVSNA